MNPRTNFGATNMAKRFAQTGMAYSATHLAKALKTISHTEIFSRSRREIGTGFIICSYSLTLVDKL